MRILLLLGAVLLMHHVHGAEDITSLKARVAKLKSRISSLTRQMMMTQLYLEEEKRTEGDTGVKITRALTSGSRSYYSASHTLDAMLAMHDHANEKDLVGLGEFIAVLNGVEFRLATIDFRLKRPGPAGNGTGELVDITFPPVPPEVNGTVDEQIEKLRPYFKNFHQNRNPKTKVPDYRPYIKPVLCYLEGMWTVNGEDTAEEQLEEVGFTAYSGRKADIDFLPTKLVEMLDVSVPESAQWRSRVACQPLDVGDDYLRPRNFLLRDDLGTRLAHNMTMDELRDSPAARFYLYPKWNPGKDPKERSYVNGVLDKMMAQVPGIDGEGAELHDEAFNEPAYPIDGSNDSPVKLNMAYNSRFYKTMNRDASGRSKLNRGFSDASLFLAMTSNPNVLPVTTSECDDASGQEVCTNFTQRCTFSIPLEIIFINPLTKWNPYNIQYKGEEGEADFDSVTADGRDGSLDQAMAWDGINSETYFMTPDSFYGVEAEDNVAGVLNQAGDLCKVRASGIQTFLPEIAGIGKIRMRYPIAPLYMEGSGDYKELDALKEIVMKQNTYQALRYEQIGIAPVLETDTDFELGITTIPVEHTHHFSVSPDDIENGKNGNTLSVFTDQAAAHSHDLRISYDAATSTWNIIECDGAPQCGDGHANLLTVLTQ